MKSAIERGIEEDVRVAAALLGYLFRELLAIQLSHLVVVDLVPLAILSHDAPVVPALQHSLVHYYAA